MGRLPSGFIHAHMGETSAFIAGSPHARMGETGCEAVGLRVAQQFPPRTHGRNAVRGWCLLAYRRSPHARMGETHGQH